MNAVDDGEISLLMFSFVWKDGSVSSSINGYHLIMGYWPDVSWVFEGTNVLPVFIINGVDFVCCEVQCRSKSLLAHLNSETLWTVFSWHSLSWQYLW